jgi:acyl-CoA reductase-like NAD-dependent aldehyde dehydrogenase
VIAQKIGPALATGNTMVVKPSPYGPLVNLWFARLIDEVADLPPGVINWVTGQAAAPAEELVSNPMVDKKLTVIPPATSILIQNRGQDKSWWRPQPFTVGPR